VVEKAAEVGAHILSGNVFETRALDELFPDWKQRLAPINTAVSADRFYILSNTSSVELPSFLIPKQLHNDGNYVISLSQLTRWLATQAEELGVEIYSGFSAAEVLYSDRGSVCGIATKEAGIRKNFQKKDTYTEGVELLGRQVIFAEGCRGSCSEEIINKFNLRKDRSLQTYGLGIKEVWEVPVDNFKAGFVQHTLGWPLQSSVFSDVFGGSFLYHMEPNFVLVGLVVGLSYKNPYINPYKEFQRWKHHPQIAKHLQGGKCISYGARCLNEGGYHSIPQLSVPGGMLVGCAAGFLNSVKIKGSHTAMKSGMIAAERLFEVLKTSETEETVEVKDYETAVMDSWVGKELFEIRNAHASFYGPLGIVGGMVSTAFSCFISRGREPWTFINNKPDSDKTEPANKHKPIDYPKPDGVLSFDLLTNLQRSGTNHEHDQPSHLVVKEELKDVPSDESIKIYAGPEQRFCPAGVYEYSDPDATGKRCLVINSQNCVHCKCCSIKTPKQYIRWTVPEGGGGPAYVNM